jgi:polo-like kinase 1
MMFRLSNKIVQVNFTDKTEILLSSESKIVTYVNKKGERSHYPLASALESNNTEMSKRLKYTKEILTHMLN